MEFIILLIAAVVTFKLIVFVWIKLPLFIIRNPQQVKQIGKDVWPEIRELLIQAARHLGQILKL